MGLYVKKDGEPFGYEKKGAYNSISWGIISYETGQYIALNFVSSKGLPDTVIAHRVERSGLRDLNILESTDITGEFALQEDGTFYFRNANPNSLILIQKGLYYLEFTYTDADSTKSELFCIKDIGVLVLVAEISSVLTDLATSNTAYWGFDSDWLDSTFQSNNGSSILSIANGSILATSGSVHYVEFLIGGTVVAVMPCEEAPRTSGDIWFSGNNTRHLIFLQNYVSWNGNKFEIITAQNLSGLAYFGTDKSWNHQKGFQKLVDNSNNNYMYIPHLDNGSTII